MMEAIVKFRQNLAAGKIQIGPTITLTDPLVTEALADSVDYVWIDTEHASMSPEAVNGHLLAARGKGIPGLVRVGTSATAPIKAALDGGGDGIIVPQVRTVEEVRSVVADCRYPPLGRRGYSPRVPSNYGRSGGAAFVEEANRSIFVSVMIENAEALQNLDAILAVPLLDSILIGPADLSLALGSAGDLNSPLMQQAFDTIIQKTRQAGLFIGSGMAMDVDFALRMVSRGVQWLQIGSDVTYLVRQADTLLGEVRNGLNR